MILSSCTIFQELRIARVNGNACFYVPSIDAQQHNLQITVTSNELGNTETQYQTDWDTSINAVANSLESCVPYSGKPFDEKRIYSVWIDINSISSSVVSGWQAHEGFCVSKTNDGNTPVFLLNQDYNTCSILSYSKDGAKPFFIVHSGKLILLGLGGFFVLIILFFKRRKRTRIKNDGF
jgi:hypothetical protein